MIKRYAAACVIALTGASYVAALPQGVVDRKPNIILIVADYMGYADIGPYGASDIKTPALDAIAVSGAKYTNFYSAAPHCISARASLLSGQYPVKALTGGVGQGKGLSSSNSNLLKALVRQGYYSAAVGKWHLGQRKDYHPLDHGFEYFYGIHDWTVGYHDHLDSDGKPGLFEGRRAIEEEGYLTDLLTEKALYALDKAGKRQQKQGKKPSGEEKKAAPFFLYLAYTAGLPPYQPRNMPKSQWPNGWEPEEASRADYVAMIEAMDEGIAHILDKVRSLGVEQDTLVIFTYDHGGRHLVDSGPLFHGFGTLWEGGIRVPLLLKWPGEISANTKITKPAIAMDLTASLISAIGEQPDGLDGVPLPLKPALALTLSQASELSDVIERPFFWRHGKMRAVRQGRWKYIEDGHTRLLFDIEADMGERENVFFNNVELAEQLRAKLDDWQSTF